MKLPNPHCSADTNNLLICLNCILSVAAELALVVNKHTVPANFNNFKLHLLDRSADKTVLAVSYWVWLSVPACVIDFMKSFPCFARVKLSVVPPPRRREGWGADGCSWLNTLSEISPSRPRMGTRNSGQNWQPWCNYLSSWINLSF